ncbi:MAG: toll/interleukin-1 receptor domain-containing protein [Cyanobacteriota bacterium]|nr:toll/interleukin-1 receptor domain-containing protein [Cyanobacteriota bacterium]
MTANVLFLQKLCSKNPNFLKGRKLFEKLQQDSDSCRIGYMVLADNDFVGHGLDTDIISESELDELDPDLIFVEGGLIAGEQWRIQEECIERYVAKGTVVMVSDVDWQTLYENRRAYERVLKFFGVSVAYEGMEPVRLYDTQNHYKSEHTIICHPQDIAYEAWLAPVYAGLPNFVVSLPVPMSAWVELVATCNRSTTCSESTIGGLFSGEPESGAFASMKRIGLGYLVLITGNVSHDTLTEAFPGNLEWLTRLADHLIERVRIDKRRNGIVQQIFISHCHLNKAYADGFRDELRRRGFGTWLDSKELIPGDALTSEIRQAIEASSHVALLWSSHCVDAPWIDLELDHALACKKRVFIIRLDDTAAPRDVADMLRIEAQHMKSHEAAKSVALFIERDEKKKKSAALEH